MLREFIFPSKVYWEERTKTYGRLVVEPLERGFGMLFPLCHTLPPYLTIFFFVPPTVFLLPFLVLELVLVCCPLTGSPLTCLMPL